LICVPEGVANSCPAEPGQAARVVPLMLQQLQGTRVLNTNHLPGIFFIMHCFSNTE
jgi:hypothetical protein